MVGDESEEWGEGRGSGHLGDCEGRYVSEEGVLFDSQGLGGEDGVVSDFQTLFSIHPIYRSCRSYHWTIATRMPNI